MSILLRDRHHAERVAAAQIRTRIAQETGSVDLHPNDARTALPGDPWKLRGIPMLGVHGGIGGAIQGTRPDAVT